jgi:hypothetical protein
MHHIISELFLEPEDSASVAPSDSEQSSKDLPITASVGVGTEMNDAGDAQSIPSEL